MRILFLTDNFPPEYNAPATRTFEHCKEWVRQGAQVTVITCFPNFPQGIVFKGYKNRLRQVEYIEGIKVIRVWSYISPNQAAFRRTLDFISFGCTSFFFGFGQKCDFIVATSPQFFTAISGCMLGLFRRKKWIMEVRDLWPESIKTVGVVKTSWIISFLEKVELFLYRKATKIIVVTDSFKENISKRGINGNKIVVIKNGVDLSKFKRQPKNIHLKKALGIENKFIIGYVGTHGLSQGLDFIIRCISKLKDNSIHFLFIGDGAERKKIIESAKNLNLHNVTFIEPVPKEEMPNYLSLLDVSLVPLRKTTTFESVIPSKIFESVAMNIPILLGVNGEARSIIETYHAGIYFEPENEEDFIQNILLIRNTLEKDPDHFTNNCQKMAFDFNRNHLAKKMLLILKELNPN